MRRRIRAVHFPLIANGAHSAETAAFLRACVRARRTIVFSGAPGSGKTTMLSCCAAELDPALRVVVAEEVFEADIPLANVWGGDSGFGLGALDRQQRSMCSLDRRGRRFASLFNEQEDGDDQRPYDEHQKANERNQTGHSDENG